MQKLVVRCKSSVAWLMACMSILLLSVANAAGTANTNVVGIVDDAKATFDYVLPIALVIAGLFLAISIGIKAWKKLSRG